MSKQNRNTKREELLHKIRVAGTDAVYCTKLKETLEYELQLFDLAELGAVITTTHEDGTITAKLTDKGKMWLGVFLRIVCGLPNDTV